MTASDVLRDVADDVGWRVGDLEEHLAGLVLGEPGGLGGAAAGLSLFASLFFLGSVAIGGQRLGAQAIQVGAAMPDFTALDEHGEVFDSRELAGHPVLIKFFRAHW